MDPQINQFLEQFVNKTLEGPGFAIYSPQEKENFKVKLFQYYSDLIFDTLLQNLTEEQMTELNSMPDLGSEEAQQKIALFSASVPNFIFILQDRLEQTSAEIGNTAHIPEPNPV